MRRSSPIIIVWFILVITLPALLLITGVRASAIDNRPTARLPRLTLRSLTHDETYRQISAALEDRLPGRDQAVNWKRDLDLDVAHDSPNKSVVLGSNGWLFLTDTWGLVCDQPHTATQLAGRLGQIADELASRGPQVSIYLVPDKTFTEGDHLGDHPGRACADARRSELRAAPRNSHVIDPYGDFERERQGGTHLFWSGDSHASFDGEFVIERQIIDSLQPELWAQVPRPVGADVDVTMDLWALLGQDRTERGTPHVFDRADVSTQARAWSDGSPRPDALVPLAAFSIPHAPDIVMEFRSTGAGPVIEGDTLIIGDSQMQRIATHLAPYFRHLTVRSYPGLSFEMPDVAFEVGASDHLVIETVERGAYNRFFSPTLPGRLGIG